MRLQSAVELQLRGRDTLKARWVEAAAHCKKSTAVNGPRPERKGIQESSTNYPSVSDMLGKLRRATCLQ